jgi:hypothetical protein
MFFTDVDHILLRQFRQQIVESDDRTCSTGEDESGLIVDSCRVGLRQRIDIRPGFARNGERHAEQSEGDREQ